MDPVQLLKSQLEDNFLSQFSATPTEAMEKIFTCLFGFIGAYIEPIKSMATIPSDLVQTAMAASGIDKLNVASPTVAVDFSTCLGTGFAAMFSAIAIELPSGDKIPSLPEAAVGGFISVVVSSFSATGGVLDFKSLNIQEISAKWSESLSSITETFISLDY